MKRLLIVVVCACALACCLCGCGAAGPATLCAQLGMPEAELTVEQDLQEAAEAQLAGNRGSVVVLESKTGRIRAIASSDTTAGGHLACKQAIPGSVFKTVTLCAWLEKGAGDLGTNIASPLELGTPRGSIPSGNNSLPDSMRIVDAYAQSCNTAFANMALKLGEKRVVDMARTLGFEAQVCADFACEQSVLENCKDMDKYELGWFGCGQALNVDGRVTGPLVTPLHMAQMYAAFANEGSLPHVWIRADHADDALGDTVAADATDAAALSAETVTAVNHAMYAVVSEGTGANAALADALVRGKTGTAENFDDTITGWFCGNAQRGNTCATVVVQIEGEKSAKAAAMAAAVLEQAL